MPAQQVNRTLDCDYEAASIALILRLYLSSVLALSGRSCDDPPTRKV
jgi:hypothetical protein